ncbi:MAG: hypothetical protein PHT31_03860 [Candidatus Omnitrophica bacterium]|nr:hypothetical protein [Candidatus Omnitrophota bacterium]MDD5653282.1 hypothetical protein [Candidatus Omnitrophota bacterium]
MKRRWLILISMLLVYFNVGFAAEWKELHEKADTLSLASALENVQRNPDSVDDLYILGLVYLNLHDDKAAESAFAGISGKDPGYYSARWGEAEVMRRFHDIEASKKMLSEIIIAHPDFAPAFISLAYLKYREEDYNGAINLVDKVIDNGREKSDLTNYVRALLIFSGSKGMLAHNGGPLAKIISGTAVFPALKKAQSLKPNEPAVFFGLGSFYLMAPGFAGGNPDKAGEYLQKAVQSDPLFADAYVRLGQYYKIKGDNKKYEECLDRALKIDPLNDLALDIKNNTCKFICF